jgi:mono/diheme cytochrome c family protein
MGRFTFEEKAEYWALVWGVVIMAITGFMMWNPIATAKFLPGEFIPAAKAAHGAEAVLAVLAIIVWHMYGVHLKRFNKAMWTGKITEEEMLEDHPLELADLKAESLASHPTASEINKRRRIYYPMALIVSLALLAGIYAFVTFETTSILTQAPPPKGVNQPAYDPQTPTPTSAAAATTPSISTTPSAAGGNLTWATFTGPLFQQKCSSCHGTSLATNGLNLSTYADALKGSTSGAVIVPSNSAGSKLIQVQSAGGHAGQLTPDEIAQVKAWIDAGALEK